MNRPLLLALALACLVPGSAAQSGPGGFRAGDIYLHTVSWSGNSSADGAIVRIDPLSGAKTVLHDLVTSGPGRQMMTYDPWRDRLLFFGGFTANHLELYAGDAAGNVQSLGMATASSGARGLLTPRGDGIVYLLDPGSLHAITYLDANDQSHVVMNAAGTAPYSFGFTGIQFQNMIYVPKTNSLIGTRWSFSDPCPGIPNDVTAIHRLDLSADGSRVVAETCFWHDSNPLDWDGETVGLAIGPNGDPILVVGDGGTGSGVQQRIATIDLATNTTTAFAGTDFFGQLRIVGGAYSRLLGKAVIHDSVADALRAFAPGEVGGGTIVATGLSASASSGETACITEIAPGSYATGLSASTGSVSLSAGGTQALTIDLGPAFAGGAYVASGSLSGWTPGFSVGGVQIPLNMDPYFTALLDFPNQFPLFDSLGTLDGQGRATMTFQVFPASPASLAGTVLHHAAVGVAGPVLRATNPVPVELVL